MSFRSCLSAVLLALAAPLAFASNVGISPTHIISVPSSAAQTVTLENRADTPTTYQLLGVAWSQSGGEDVLEKSGDLLFSPTMLTVAPKSKRVVRLINNHPRPGQNTYYRLLARELPPAQDAKSGKQASLAVLVTYSLPVAFEPASAATPVVEAHLHDGKLWLANTGGSHASITGLAQQGSKAWQEGALGWVLPGASMPYGLPKAGLKVGDTVAITVNGAVQTVKVAE